VELILLLPIQNLLRSPSGDRTFFAVDNYTCHDANDAG